MRRDSVKNFFAEWLIITPPYWRANIPRKNWRALIRPLRKLLGSIALMGDMVIYFTLG